MLAHHFLIFLLLAAPLSAFSAELDRKGKVLADQRDVLDAGFWIYNDLPKGFETARQTGKPLLVVLRCIP